MKLVKTIDSCFEYDFLRYFVFVAITFLFNTLLFSSSWYCTFLFLFHISCEHVEGFVDGNSTFHFVTVALTKMDT